MNNDIIIQTLEKEFPNWLVFTKTFKMSDIPSHSGLFRMPKNVSHGNGIYTVQYSNLHCIHIHMHSEIQCTACVNSFAPVYNNNSYLTSKYALYLKEDHAVLWSNMHVLAHRWRVTDCHGRGQW